MKHNRKFSIELPRLKIGSIKPFKQNPDPVEPPAKPYIESPPPTPKSLRPALPSHVEADLRAACTAVVKESRPSPKYCDLLASQVLKQQLDYAAIKATAHQDDGLAGYGHRQRAAATGLNHAPRVDPSRHRRTSVLNDVLTYHGEGGHTLPEQKAVSRAEMLMVGHQSVSNRQNISVVAADFSGQHVLDLQRPRPPYRTDSAETTGSTPHTDTTDYPWSEKASTAMTSAVVTPAAGSNRGSGQAEGGKGANVSANETPRAYWAEQDRGQGSKHALRTSQSDGPAKLVQVPARKPVPSRQSGTVCSGRDTAQTSTLSLDYVSLAPSTRRHASDHSGPTSTSTNAMHERGRQGARPQSRQSDAKDAGRPRSRSITQHVKDFIRSSSRGRSSSIVDSIRAHSRPQSRGQSRDRGDEDRFLQRSSSRSRWRTWTPLHRRGRSTDSLDQDRPGSSHSNAKGRHDPSDAAAKPAVDLNRALPPLPGLDKWKDAEEMNKPRPASRVDPLRCNPPEAEPKAARRPSNRRFSKSYNDMPRPHSSQAQQTRPRAHSVERQENAPFEQARAARQPGVSYIARSDSNKPKRSASVFAQASVGAQLFELEGSSPLSLDPSRPARVSRPEETILIGHPIGKRRVFLRNDSEGRNSREFGGGLRQTRRHIVEQLDGPVPSRYQAHASRNGGSPDALEPSVDSQRFTPYSPGQAPILPSLSMATRF